MRVRAVGKGEGQCGGCAVGPPPPCSTRLVVRLVRQWWQQ